MIMCCSAIFILTTFVAVTVSAVSIEADKYYVNDGESVRLTCTVPDFNDTIYVIQGNTNRAVCFANGACNPTNTTYSVSKSGSTNVIFTILSFSKDWDVGSWFVRYGTSTASTKITLHEFESPISQMNTSIATVKTTSVNSVIEFNNITLPMITGSITTTSDISALTTVYFNTGSTNFNVQTESTYFYSKTETTHSYANAEATNLNTNIETTNVDANTIGFEKTTLRIVTTTANDITGSFDTTSHIMNETIALPTGYSISSYNEITLPSGFVTSNVFPQTFSVTSIAFFVGSLSDNPFHNLFGSSGSLITTDSSMYSLFLTNSPLISTTLIDQMLYSFKMEHSSLSSNQYLSETTLTLPQITVTSKYPSPIIETANHLLYTTTTLIPSYLDDTSIFSNDFTDGFKTLPQDYAASASMSSAIFFNSTDHYLSLQTTENYETMQTEIISYESTILYESHTDMAATAIHSEEIMTLETSYMHTSVMPSQTRNAYLNDIKDSTTDFHSTNFELYSKSNDEIFSSEVSEYLLSTLQSTSLLLPFNARTNASWLESNIKTTHMWSFESQSGILTIDPSLFTNPSPVQMSTVLLDFKTTLLTSTINANSKNMPSKIKYTSKETNSGISYIEIETSFKESLFSVESFYGSFTSNDQYMTSLSSDVYKPETKTIQSGLSEKNKTIIFITTTSVVIAMFVVILLIVFVKIYMSKSKEQDNISWSNKSIPPKTAFPDYLFSGKRMYPLMSTSSVSFEMFRYEKHWNDIV